MVGGCCNVDAAVVNIRGDGRSNSCGGEVCSGKVDRRSGVAGRGSVVGGSGSSNGEIRLNGAGGQSSVAGSHGAGDPYNIAAIGRSD